ncbi:MULTISPECIES: SAVED domain-containing protein [Nostocales]|uniref:SAVED domain-containing protein n=3 Tax=Nostocales TaxID=1161 RepID=A0A8S9T9D2_9CYAN|nr:SAVED domain-containing protein [Tolypothrix bouteillei]KAF3889090.1 SAVED domain-containing protein [Tolypothrix bouteillei VB521301]
MTNSPKRILILSANPTNITRLRLDEEVREIETAIERAQQRDQFELRACGAITHRELRRAILRENPQIVHFCGHGMGEEGLVLKDDNTGEVKFVSTYALAELFKLFADKVECVLLNACYSEVQAKAIAQHIDYVIGMKQSINDLTAIEFAAGFYDALGAGRGYEFAYNLGRNSISLAGIDQADIPILKKQTRVRLWIHGWVKQMYDNLPTVELDWTEYFSLESASGPRRIANQETWKNILLPNLEQVREQVSQGHTELTVDIRGKLPLSAAVVIGHVFQDTRGYTLQVEQRTIGQNELWRSDISASTAKFKIVKEDGEAGEDILVALGITGNASRDIEQLRQDSPIPLSAVVYAEPEAGIGERAISSNADATALTIHAKEIIRETRQKYRASSTHLVLFAPMSFCFFLGQRLRCIGDVICYERVAEKYQPSVKLCTG